MKIKEVIIEYYYDLHERLYRINVRDEDNQILESVCTTPGAINSYVERFKEKYDVIKVNKKQIN